MGSASSTATPAGTWSSMTYRRPPRHGVPPCPGASGATTVQRRPSACASGPNTSPEPVHEPVLDYAPGSPERGALERRLPELTAVPLDLTHTIGGREVEGDGKPLDVVQPHARRSVLGTLRNATTDDARAAVDATLA